MKLLRILNALALLLIFAPFFQMCSEDPDQSSAKVFEDSVAVNEVDQLLQDRGADSIHSPSWKTQNTEPKEEKALLKKIWDTITFPGKNVTGFGFAMVVIFSAIDGDFDFGLPAVLNLVSVVLTISTLILLFVRRVRHIHLYFMLNVMVTLITGLAVSMQSDYDQPVKWGFFAYFATLLLAAVVSFRGKASLQSWSGA